MYKHMNTDVIAIRIDQDTSDLVMKLMKHRLARNKTDAIKFIMQKGMNNAKDTIARKEQSAITVKMWRKKGLPKLSKNISDLSMRERE